MNAFFRDSSRHLGLGLLCLSAVFGFQAATAEAQPPGGGGRGMRGGGRPSFFEPGSILPFMRDEDFLKELKFTEKQQQQLDDVRKEYDFRQMFRLPEDER